MAISFSRQLIKGRIAEVVFEQMIREEERFTVIPFGYEHTMPTLAQYRHVAKIKSIIDNIADAPDFVLISTDNTQIYLVEVKYQKTLNIKQAKEYAEKLLERWEHPWLFVATASGFYCQRCSEILERGRINKLPAKWVSKKRQADYQNLLNEFG